MKHDVEVRIKKRVFRNEDTMFSIYGCDVLTPDVQLERSKFGTVSIQGTARLLNEGGTYRVKLEGPKEHERHGTFYEIKWVEEETLDTIEKQDRFLASVVTENQYHSLKNAYPNHMIVDMILNSEIDTNQTKGIGKATLETIKEKINDNKGISVLIACLSELNLSPSKAVKIYNHFDQNSDLAVSAIENNIYCLCDIKSFGFKTVDKIAMTRGDKPTNQNRIKSGILHLLDKDVQEGHTWSTFTTLMEDAVELLNLNESLIAPVMEQLKEQGRIRTDGQRIANTTILKQEIQILKELERIRDSYVTVSDVDERASYRIQAIEQRQGFKFTDEQLHAIKDGVHHGVMVLNGCAGSGKSQTVNGLIEVLGTSNYIACALSGKAVQVLAQRGVEAKTIHRTLELDEKKRFIHNEKNPLSEDVVIVDEVSMVDVNLLLSVLKAVKDGAKLILVGDSGQLPAIGYGDVLRDLLATQYFPCYELTKVHRQAAKSGILSLANEVRSGNQIVPFNVEKREVYGELQDQSLITVSKETKDSIVEAIMNIATSYKKNIKTPEDLVDFQVIVANRERGHLSVRNLNYALQTVFNEENKPYVEKNNYQYRMGDKVIAQGNSYRQLHYTSTQDFMDNYANDKYVYDMKDAQYEEYKEAGGELERRGNLIDIFNGTLGYIHALDPKNKVVLIKFESTDCLVPFFQEDMNKIDMAYAITVHRSQGSGVKNVVFALDYGAYTLLSRQLVYTGLTRASEWGLLICENNALHAAVNKNASDSRRTMLGELIRDKMDQTVQN